FKNIIFAVDADRCNGIRQLLTLKNKPKLILLDDAFQHRKVKAGFYVLLTNYNNLFVDDFVLPAGNLRESKAAAKRAHIVVVTKCPENLSKTTQYEITKKLNLAKHQHLFFSFIKYSKNIIGNQSQIKLQELKHYEVLLLTGIAFTKPLLEFLKVNEIKFKHISFPDHHRFLERDIDLIQFELNSIIATKKIILTTEKDYVRLDNSIKKLFNNLFYLPIETVFLSKKSTFDKLIIDYVKS
ncbi:MAG: tetraacyldisaccharide 4'-kinase, partial [Tenacibaculum sp.]